jgi:glycosyltransferase involved in cell wall biosynthesis
MAPFSVSIIIPAYNCADTITAVLQAVRAQSWPGRLEVLLVDDGSTDRTAELAASFPDVRCLSQANAGPASARNAGARAARGDIFLFTDSDCLPEPDWVEKMLAGFDCDSIAVVAGSYGIANPEDWLAAVIHDEIRFRHERLLPEFPRAFGSYNFAIRRAVFEQAGGFDPSYRYASGEDNDLSYRILSSGRRIRFLRQAQVRHFHQSDLGAYLKEQFRHGFWRVKMYVDHPSMLRGDDYTFWKDIMELPAVFLAVILLFFAGPVPAFAWLFLFWLFEVIAAGLMMRVRNKVNAGTVFFLRAFARAAGFFSGGLAFSKFYILKMKNN